MDDIRHQAIRGLVETLQATQSDIETFLPLHTPDTIIVNFGGRRVLGRDDLREAMASALASPLADVTTTTEIHDIRFVRPDVAIVSCTKHVHDVATRRTSSRARAASPTSPSRTAARGGSRSNDTRRRDLTATGQFRGVTSFRKLVHMSNADRLSALEGRVAALEAAAGASANEGPLPREAAVDADTFWVLEARRARSAGASACTDPRRTLASM